MDRNSNSDIEVEPYEEIVRSVSYPNPMDARSLNSSAGLTFQTTVCEPIFSNGRDELGNAHSTVLSTSVPWPALRQELAWEERAAVVPDQNGRVSVSTHGQERNFSIDLQRTRKSWQRQCDVWQTLIIPASMQTISIISVLKMSTPQNQRSRGTKHKASHPSRGTCPSVHPYIYTPIMTGLFWGQWKSDRDY